MDNIASVRKPIGLSDAVQAIEEMCNNRAAYAHGGVRVQPIMLELGAGNGQTVFLRYVTDMLKAHKIRHFGGLDHYLEFVTDGTLEQLKEMFADIDMRGLPQKQNARRADKIRLCGHLSRYKKIVKKTYII